MTTGGQKPTLREDALRGYRERLAGRKRRTVVTCEQVERGTDHRQPAGVFFGPW